MESQKRFELSDNDKLSIAQAVFGEGANASPEVMKMMAQSMINRARSGRKEDFGATIPEILQKGYYAVSKQNKPYKQAVSNKFPDALSKEKWGIAQQVVKNILQDQDFGDVLFYFTPEEETEMKKKGKKVFDFSKVKPKGKADKYNLYSY